MRHRRALASSIFSWLFVFFAVPAWAKKVAVEWKPMKGAVSYEISIERNGKPVLAKKSASTQWSGELENGVYAYQIRAYDRVNRAGAWSSAHALVVMPKSPDPTFPESGQNIVTYTSKSKTKLKWNPVEGAEGYTVRVRSGGSVVFEKIVHDTETELTELPPGKYTWQVAVHYEANGRAPASLGGKKWDGKGSEEADFSVEHHDLQSPELVFPQGALAPPADGAMHFEWKPVEGAQAYELTVSPKRLRADQKVKEVKWVVSSNNASARIPGDGSYTWGVRALASVNEKNVAEAIGGQSSTEFTFDPHAGLKQGQGYAAVSTLVAPYHYRANSPSQNSFTQNQAGSTAVGMRASGEYWIQPHWGFSLMGQDTFFTINNTNLDRKDIVLDSKYRVNLSSSAYPWTLAPKFGLQMRQYVLLTSPSNGPPGSTPVMSSNIFATFGPDAGVDIRKQFSDRFSLGAQFSYYYPMSSGDGSVVRGSDSNRNFALGVQGLYWLNKLWGLGAGVYTENRSISVQSSAAPDTIENDGTYFFGSVIYNFGM